jgi:hypothetical protein
MGQRSDNVFDLFLLPALRDKFKLDQPGNEPSTSITADIFKHLKDDDLIVAFLGSPYRIPTMGNNWLWNPNVMLEAGYRMALRRPLLFIREKRVQDDEPLLPFDLYDISVIELVSADEEKERANREKIIKRIRENAEAIVGPARQESKVNNVYTYPAVTMAFEGGRGTITTASDDAASFLRYPSEKNLVGLDAGEFVKKLTSEMAPSQRAAFSEEQDRLFGIIFLGRKPLATICIVFGKDAIQPGARVDNAYLPLVTRFSANGGEATILEVIYLNVTATAIVSVDGVVRCFLGMSNPQH